VRIRAKLPSLVALLLLGATGSSEALAQFNPSGRRRPRPTTARPAPRPRPTARTPEAAKAPSSEALIARYTKIVLDQPGAQFPLQRLAQLYRERDGGLDQLVAELQKLAAGSTPEAWNALVALAGIYRQDGQHQLAVTTYERAITARPKSAVARIALGHLLNDRGDKSGAVTQFDRALPDLKDDAEREQILRLLLQLTLDLKRWDAAKKYHQQLLHRSKGSFYVRAELGRELLMRGHYARAVDEFQGVVKAATGDNRVLAPALRDLGQALYKVGRSEEALKTLRRALQVAGAQAGIRREIYLIIVEVYRAEERLPELVTELEGQPSNDFERWRLLGSLYEETGQIARALEAYRRALQRNARDIETRIKVVQLLQIQGELDAAIKEYEALIRAAPRNPDFVFQLAEALIQRGDRDGALAQLKKLEARSTRDEETLAALVDFYERVGEMERSLAVLKRLSAIGSGDPRHLVELGDRYWQEGDKDKARKTWERIRVVVQDRALAQVTLGEVYLEHGMPQEGLEAMRAAVKLKPKLEKFRKAYALALERTGAAASSQGARKRQYDEARRIWEDLLHEAGDNAHLAQEARQHIVSLYSLSGDLGQRVMPLQRRFERQPPDLEAGRLLGEVQIRLRDYPAAERTFRQVVKLAPGDVYSLTRLERVLALQRKLRSAIAVLEQLVKAEPKRAREYYQRMAQYAAELYQDDDAIRYAARAVELSPDDADGHRKLGEMYRRRQETGKAIQAFRQAIAKNDRMFAVYFQLAELLLSQGKVDEADRLLRRVVRASPDEDLVARAARLSMQVNLGRGTLESLEKELLPVALGNPGKPLYRRLLVEIYGALAFPLVHQMRSQNADEAETARTSLRRIGERAVKPLLDALGDARGAQQRIAIELLSHIQNQSAGPALFAYATGTAEPELRVRAMIAVGTLRDPELLPKLGGLLAPSGTVRADESDPVAVAAAWAVAQMRSPKASPLLARLLESDAPTIRAFGALGLGWGGQKGAAKRLAEVATSLDAGPLPRAAAAFALGELDAKGYAPTLAQLAEASDPTVRGTAIVALARLGAASALRSIAEALVSPDAELQQAAVAAALVSASGEYHNPNDTDRTPQGLVDGRAVLLSLQSRGYTPEQHAIALVRLAPELSRACVAAVQSSPERARTVADALLARDGKPAYGPFTRDLSEASQNTARAAEAAAESIAAAVVGPFVAMAQHPSAAVRSRAVQFLSTRSENDATAAVVHALSDPDERVQRAAIAAIGKSQAKPAIGAVAVLLASKQTWPVRVRAAEVLGTLAAETRHPEATRALKEAAQTDEYALVREAAVTALAAVNPEAAGPVLQVVQRSDAEPRLRELAANLLRKRP